MITITRRLTTLSVHFRIRLQARAAGRPTSDFETSTANGCAGVLCGRAINLIYRKVPAQRLRYERAWWDAAGRGNMTKEDCRANALKCYQFAQKATDREVRRTLFDLSVQWRELADQIERLESDTSATPATGARQTVH